MDFLVQSMVNEKSHGEEVTYEKVLRFIRRYRVTERRVMDQGTSAEKDWPWGPQGPEVVVIEKFGRDCHALSAGSTTHSSLHIRQTRGINT